MWSPFLALVGALILLPTQPLADTRKIAALAPSGLVLVMDGNAANAAAVGRAASGMRTLLAAVEGDAGGTAAAAAAAST